MDNGVGAQIILINNFCIVKGTSLKDNGLLDEVVFITNKKQLQSIFQ